MRRSSLTSVLVGAAVLLLACSPTGRPPPEPQRDSSRDERIVAAAEVSEPTGPAVEGTQVVSSAPARPRELVAYAVEDCLAVAGPGDDTEPVMREVLARLPPSTLRLPI